MGFERSSCFVGGSVLKPTTGMETQKTKGKGPVYLYYSRGRFGPCEREKKPGRRVLVWAWSVWVVSRDSEAEGRPCRDRLGVCVQFETDRFLFRGDGGGAGRRRNDTIYGTGAWCLEDYHNYLLHHFPFSLFSISLGFDLAQKDVTSPIASARRNRIVEIWGCSLSGQIEMRHPTTLTRYTLMIQYTCSALVLYIITRKKNSERLAPEV